MRYKLQGGVLGLLTLVSQAAVKVQQAAAAKVQQQAVSYTSKLKVLRNLKILRPCSSTLALLMSHNTRSFDFLDSVKPCVLMPNYFTYKIQEVKSMSKQSNCAVFKVLVFKSCKNQRWQPSNGCNDVNANKF